MFLNVLSQCFQVPVPVVVHDLRNRSCRPPQSFMLPVVVHDAPSGNRSCSAQSLRRIAQLYVRMNSLEFIYVDSCSLSRIHIYIYIYSILRIAEVLRRIAEICGDCYFPPQSDLQVLRRFAEATNNIVIYIIIYITIYIYIYNAYAYIYIYI